MQKEMQKVNHISYKSIKKQPNELILTQFLKKEPLI